MSHAESNETLARRIVELSRRESELKSTLKECVTFLRASAINPSTGLYTEDRLALIRTIEEQLK